MQESNTFIKYIVLCICPVLYTQEVPIIIGKRILITLIPFKIRSTRGQALNPKNCVMPHH